MKKEDVISSFFVLWWGKDLGGEESRTGCDRSKVRFAFMGATSDTVGVADYMYDAWILRNIKIYVET